MDKRREFADISKVVVMKCTHIQYYHNANIGKSMIHNVQ